MVNYLYDFSVIIPHKDSLHFLPKLFSTIPSSDKIQVILVDNSTIPITRADVQTDKFFILLYSLPERGAGGARNEGIKHAQGKWLVFADADDFFTDDAFKVFYANYNSEAELLFFGIEGIYSDTCEQSIRGSSLTKLLRDYLNDKKSEMDIRLGFITPCAKMISRGLLERHNISFDEVVASNDVYFSLLTGYYAIKIEAVDKIVYIATVSRGSLTRRRDYSVIKDRFNVALRYNKFVKEHHLPKYQQSIMIFLYQGSRFGVNILLQFLKLLIDYKQNPFIGYKRWIKTYLSDKKNTKKESKYITY